MRTLYNTALLPLRAAAFAYGAWPRTTAEATLERDQRLGRRLPRLAPGAIWIHGASVGEARLATALARGLRARTHAPIALSAVTPTGRALLPGPPAADGAFFLPLDFPDVQRRAFDAIAPSELVLVETELWPNLLATASARGVPVVVVNARLAPERFDRYRRLSGLYAPLLRGVAAVGAATDAEAERFRALGVSPEAVRVTGSLKFDIEPPAVDAGALRARLAVGPERRVVAAGSTGAGEDAPVLDAFARARRERPGLLLLLAPRHPERFDAAAAEASRRGFAVARLSRADRAAEADVLVVDTIGELAALYALADAAFVGGTLVPVGGHNLLEPVAAGAPVLFGPHTGHVTEIAAALEACGAGIRVESAEGLAAEWTRLSDDSDERARRAEAGRALLDRNRGALARSVDLVLDARGAR